MRTNPDTIKAVAMLTDALAILRRESRAADRLTETSAPGSPEERYALQLGRMVNHLGETIADVPTELWLSMCNAVPAVTINKTQVAA